MTGHAQLDVRHRPARDLLRCRPVELRVLQYFVATADAGSVSAAAEVVHVTQPALSRQLRVLERQLGVDLFERRSGRLELSSAGQQFVPIARDLLGRSEAAERAAASFAAGRLTSVRLAVPTTTLTDVLAPFLATLGAGDPVPIVRELDPRGALAALHGGSDLAIVTEPPARGLAGRLMAVLPVWAYVCRDDPWADRTQVDVSELAERPLVLMTPEFTPRRLLDAAIEAAGVAYGEVVECTNAQVAQALAASGRGVAVVSDDPRFELTGLRVTGGGRPLRIRLYAAWEPHHHATATLDALAERLAAFIVAKYGPDVAAGS